jgi:hypothetical protein
MKRDECVAIDVNPSYGISPEQYSTSTGCTSGALASAGTGAVSSVTGAGALWWPLGIAE